MSAAVAVTPPPRPPPPAVPRQQEVGGAGHTSQQGGDQEGEERTIRRLSGELTQASDAGEDSDTSSTETRRRSYTYSTPPRRQTEHTPSPPPARNNSPAHAKPKPERPPPPSKESLRKPARPPPPMKRAHSVPRRVHASTAVRTTAGGRPYSKSNIDIHRLKANTSAQQPEAATTPRQNGGVVSNGDHAQEPSRPSHSPTLHTPTEERGTSPVGNGAPPGDRIRDTPPHRSPEGQEPRSPVATSDGGDLPPVKPPRKKASSKSPSQSPAHSPQCKQKEERKAVSDGDGLPCESGTTSVITPDQPAIVPMETANSRTPPEGNQTAGQPTKQLSSPVESTRPVIPPRPYRPPRPFPPPSQRPPPKTGSHDLSPGSPDPQMVPSEDGNEAQSRQKSPDRSSGSPDQSRESHDQTVESHDQKGSETAASSGQNGSAQPEFVEVSLTTEIVGGANSEGEPPPQAKTLFELNEAEDQVSPLHSSPKSRGKKLLNSMKKSFRSLRVKKPERQPEEKSKRSHSLDSRSALQATPTSHTRDTHTYPDPLPQGVIHPLVVRCVAYLNREEVLKEEGLFRIPGDVATIRKLRGQFVSGQDVDLSDIMDPHTVTGLLKVHFREQRVSLIPRGQPLAEVSQAVKARDLEAVRHVLSRVAVIHIATLRVITEVLTKVTEFSEVNQMTSGTLATSCGPSLFPYLPPSNANALLKFLIDHCSDLFQE